MCDLHKVPNGPLFQVRSIEDAFTGICYGSSLSLTLVLKIECSFLFSYEIHYPWELVRTRARGPRVRS